MSPMDEAAKLFARAREGELTPAERAQLAAWLAESPQNVREYLDTGAVWIALQAQDFRPSEPKTQLLEAVRTSGRSNVFELRTGESNTPASHCETAEIANGAGALSASPLRQWIFAVATALSIFGLLVTTAMWIPHFRGQVIETERGERREVVLNDGTVVQVDPQTQLRVRYSSSMRQVLLEHGRALFHVARNASRPFLVEVDGTTVRAVGTAFGVERQQQGIIVTVAEGKVAIVPTPAHASYGRPRPAENSESRPIPPGPPRPARLLGAHSRIEVRAGVADSEKPASPAPVSGRSDEQTGPLFLVADQQVIVESSGSAEPVHAVDSHRALAWAEGRLIFHNESVGRIVAQFNRYNRVQLGVTDTALANRPVSGIFNAAEPEGFIAFLETVAPVAIERDGDMRITIGSRRPR